MKQKRWFRFLFAENKRSDRLFLRVVCIAVPLIVLWVAFAAGFPEAAAKIYPGCPVLRWTGLYCPGCGGTHALKALAHGQIAKSLHFHPLVLPTVVFTAVYLVAQLLWKLTKGRTPKPHFRNIYFVLLIALALYHVIALNIRADL
ncbi:MAG: DUF2752 domain-containing protein [Lachnospiraceae bacterium]|nr:DUF2752 domain-containing protein [Lachnospiraceae bacterium]